MEIYLLLAGVPNTLHIKWLSAKPYDLFKMIHLDPSEPSVWDFQWKALSLVKVLSSSWTFNRITSCPTVLLRKKKIKKKSNEQIHSPPIKTTSYFQQLLTIPYNFFSPHLPLTIDELHRAKNVFPMGVVLMQRTVVFCAKLVKFEGKFSDSLLGNFGITLILPRNKLKKKKKNQHHRHFLKCHDKFILSLNVTLKLCLSTMPCFCLFFVCTVCLLASFFF